MSLLKELVGITYFKSVITVFVSLVLAKGMNISLRRISDQMAKRTRTNTDEIALSMMNRPVCITIILQGLREALRYLELSPHYFKYGDALLASGIVLVWIFAGIRLSSFLVNRAVLHVSDITGIGEELVPLFRTAIRVLIVGTGCILTLSIWDINITPLLASAGIAGVAVALAAKETLANFFGGVSIFMDKSYKIGDYIILDSGERGEVTEIGIRSTRIKTRDDVVITIPNSIMANSKIINESVPVERFRLRTAVGVAYGSDIVQVESLLIQAASENPRVSREPVPTVRFRAFGDSALQFELICWIRDPADKGIITHELNKAIYQFFTRNDIKIPFPQRDIHIYQTTASG